MYAVVNVSPPQQIRLFSADQIGMPIDIIFSDFFGVLPGQRPVNIFFPVCIV
jgi:hypothetical protein